MRISSQVSGHFGKVNLKGKLLSSPSESEGSVSKRYKSVNQRDVLNYKHANDSIISNKSNNDFLSKLERNSMAKGKNSNDFELPDLSRMSERKRIKISQGSKKKKLPGCFSNLDEDFKEKKQLKREFNNTLDISLR